MDAVYAAAGVAGAASLLTIDALRLGLGVIGVTVLVVLGVRSLWTAFRVQTGDEIPADVASPARAFLTSLGATASNPLTIVSWAAVFAAVSTATDASALALVARVGVGSLTWVCLLAVAVAVVRRSVGPRGVRIADALAGLGMLGFAGALGYRVADG